MVEAATRSPVETFGLKIHTTYNYDQIAVSLMVLDPLTQRVLVESERPFADLASAGQWAEGGLWAYITTGPLGLMSFIESQLTRRLPESP